jgi:RNA polymerase sigma factor (sigma-70 family)
MNVHFSYKIEKTAYLENLLQKNIEKLQRYLQVFRPDLVHLKGIVEENTPKEGYACSLNLRLPSGQLAAHEGSSTLDVAVKTAFDAITEQLKKHKELLRDHHKGHRRRGPGQRAVSTVPFEETLAAMKPETISSVDVSNYINVNLPRLQRFVQRELEYRQSQGQLQPDQLAVEEVVGEAIGNALEDHRERPERIKLEPWLYRLATDAIARLTSPNGDEGRIPLERSYGTQAAHDVDDPAQSAETEERLYSENVIPDPHANNPEEIAARRELIGLVERTLLDAGRHEREAFILFTVEGFTLDEIADITNRTLEEVRASIRKAREHLERALPLQDTLKDKLVEYSKSA